MPDRRCLRSVENGQLSSQAKYQHQTQNYHVTPSLRTNNLPNLLTQLTHPRRLGHDLAEKSPLWATRGKNWTGTAGMSLERWDFWKGRFQAVASSEAREENKKIAQTAVGAMEIVESAGEG